MLWHSDTTTQLILKQLYDLIPEDFDYKTYISKNTDLKKKGIDSEQKAKEHYILYGRKEGRIYKLNNQSSNKKSLINSKKILKEYKNFDPKIYKIINPDLTNMTDEQATNHFIECGIKEHRIYKTDYSYDQILKILTKQQDAIKKTNKQLSSIVLINHDSSLTGAPILLRSMYEFIINKQYFQNVYLIDAYPHKLFCKKQNKNWLYHLNDPNILLNILDTINPNLIFSNSLNIYLYHNNMYQKYLYKTIFSFLEYYKHFNNFVSKSIQNSIKNCKIYVPSNSILQEFKSNGFNNLTIFPSYLSDKQYDKTKKYYDIKKSLKNINSNVTIGMCGSICERKNFDLFYFLAENMPEINFIWVGASLPPEKKPLVNLTNIQRTDDPYKYINQMDYFLLTSKEDPCPVVILEALALNKKIITLDKNISYQHPSEYLENYIIIKNHNNDNEVILNKIKNLNLSTDKNNTKKNINYVKNNFLIPSIFDVNKKIKKHTIGLSYYCHKNFKIIDLNYYLNLINQFIIRSDYNPNIVLSICSDRDKQNDITEYFEKFCLIKPIILFRKNIGYDIGGLIEIIKYIYLNKFDENDSLFYLHNKSSTAWREDLHKIMYCDVYEKYDTVVSEKYTISCDLTDNNRIILANHNFMKHISMLPFSFIAGTTFITKIKHLTNLYNNSDYIIQHLTSIDTDDIFWQNNMNDEKQFNKILCNINNCPHTTNMDEDSREIYLKYKCKNYLELFLKYNKRGIPDLQFEHALERYIGYLILNNKKIKTI